MLCLLGGAVVVLVVECFCWFWHVFRCVFVEGFCCLDFGYGLHYRKPFKSSGHIYEKSDEQRGMKK